VTVRSSIGSPQARISQSPQAVLGRKIDLHQLEVKWHSVGLQTVDSTLVLTFSPLILDQVSVPHTKLSRTENWKKLSSMRSFSTIREHASRMTRMPFIHSASAKSFPDQDNFISNEHRPHVVHLFHFGCQLTGYPVCFSCARLSLALMYDRYFGRRLHWLATHPKLQLCLVRLWPTISAFVP
jgi:hypothetical protein